MLIVAHFLRFGAYVNLADKSGTETFINIFKTLHESGKLKELKLTGTGIKNIKAKLQSSGVNWKTLACDG